MPSTNNENKQVYSALEVAQLCGVVNQTAINWIRAGHLKAYQTPGGQFRVYPSDLIEFMNSRKIKVPQQILDLDTQNETRESSLLIVDDDKGLNTILAKYIAERIPGIRILQAFDGFDAGAKLMEKHPKCLILDLDLPGIDGVDLCKRIHNNMAFGKPEIIVVTALDDPKIKKQVLNLGASKFFRKPLEFAAVCEAVASVIELN